MTAGRDDWPRHDSPAHGFADRVERARKGPTAEDFWLGNVALGEAMPPTNPDLTRGGRLLRRGSAAASPIPVTVRRAADRAESQRIAEDRAGTRSFSFL